MAVRFPWPRDATAVGVIACGDARAPEWPPWGALAIDGAAERVARAAERVLRQRWPASDVRLVRRSAVDAILQHARRAGAIVVGSRGHGGLVGLMLGSVSRGVVRSAACPVLVVKQQRASVRHLVVGLDGSVNARRAVALVGRLVPPRGGRVTLVQVVEPVRFPSLGLLPGHVRGMIAGEARAFQRKRVQAAPRAVQGAVRELGRAGWRARGLVRLGVPARELLAIAGADADVLVVGARGTGGVRRLLLGSVANTVLNESRVPVLIVK
jgi:nucleotide-binding universal stress UspA family protein